MFYIVETQIELNLDSTFLAIVFFGVFANLSGIVPSTSGGWGPFELIGTIVLISFGADRESAAAFTIIVHLILWLPISIIGLICFLYEFFAARPFVPPPRSDERLPHLVLEVHALHVRHQRLPPRDRPRPHRRHEPRQEAVDTSRAAALARRRNPIRSGAVAPPQ